MLFDELDFIYFIVCSLILTSMFLLSCSLETIRYWARSKNQTCFTEFFGDTGNAQYVDVRNSGFTCIKTERYGIYTKYTESIFKIRLFDFLMTHDPKILRKQHV